MNNNLDFQFGMYEPATDSVIINTGENAILVIRCKECNSSVIFDDPTDIVYLYRLVLFILAVAITRYVSLGSILVVISFLIQAIVFNHMGLLGVSGNYAVEFDILAACFTAMAIWRHRANIKRLLSGTENKFGQKTK